MHHPSNTPVPDARTPGRSAFGFPWARLTLAAFGLLLLLLGRPDALATELPYGRGLLWKIEGAGAAPSYVLGTMHSSDPAVLDLPGPVKQAFAETRSMTTEMVIDAVVQQRMAAAMVLTNGRTLDQILGPERFAALARVAATYGFQPAQLQRLKPWAAMTIISLAPSEFARSKQGHRPLDEALQAAAEQRGRPIHGLETVDEQMAVFDDVPEAEQVALLDVALREHPNIEHWFTQMRNAYLARDTGALYRMMTAQAAGTDPALIAAFEDRLIDDRNHRMVARMRPLLTAGGAFIAVGALHLPGQVGVLSLLAQDGWRVSHVY